MRRRLCNRKGATVIEFAIVGPITLLLLIGLLVGGVGVFRKHQVALLARNGARWAAVHGPEYQKRNKKTITPADVYASGIRPMAVGLNQDDLSYDVVWDSENTTVSITVSYVWAPQAFFSGGKLTATSVMPITY